MGDERGLASVNASGLVGAARIQRVEADSIVDGEHGSLGRLVGARLKQRTYSERYLQRS